MGQPLSVDNKIKTYSYTLMIVGWGLFIFGGAGAFYFPNQDSTEIYWPYWVTIGGLAIAMLGIILHLYRFFMWLKGKRKSGTYFHK